MFTNDSKQKRIDIFEDTLYLCQKDENLKKLCTKLYKKSGFNKRM